MSAEADAVMEALTDCVAYLAGTGEIWIWDGQVARYYKADKSSSRESEHTPEIVERILRHKNSDKWKRIAVPAWFTHHKEVGGDVDWISDAFLGYADEQRSRKATLYGTQLPF